MSFIPVCAHVTYTNNFLGNDRVVTFTRFPITSVITVRCGIPVFLIAETLQGFGCPEWGVTRIPTFSHHEQGISTSEWIIVFSSSGTTSFKTFESWKKNFKSPCMISRHILGFLPEKIHDRLWEKWDWLSITIDNVGLTINKILISVFINKTFNLRRVDLSMIVDERVDLSIIIESR